MTAVSLRPRSQPLSTLLDVLGLVFLGLGAIGWLLISVAMFFLSPGGRVVALALAPLTVPIVLAPFLLARRSAPKQRRLLVVAFAWGAFAAYGIANVVNPIAMLVVGCYPTITTFGPFIEEVSKALVLIWIVFSRRSEFTGPLDGIVYGGLAGAGFAFSENIDYYTMPFLGLIGESDICAPSTGGPTPPFSEGLGTSLTTFFARGLMTPFIHPLFTALTGLGIGIAITAKRRDIRIVAPFAGLGLAVLSHGLFNFSASTGEWTVFIGVGVTWIGAGVLFWAMHRIARRNRETVGARIPDFVGYGWIRPWETDAFTTARGRRQSVAYWRGHYGPRWAEVLQIRQEAAVRLALLPVQPSNAPYASQLQHELNRLRPNA